MPAKILVVDDNEDQLATLSEILKAMGHSTVLAESSIEALQLLEQSPFDLVITDVVMPGMDGIAFAKLARAVGKSVPVVLITGVGGAVESTLERGMIALLKPVSPEMLESVVAEALNQVGPCGSPGRPT